MKRALPLFKIMSSPIKEENSISLIASESKGRRFFFFDVKSGNTRK
jgi:hypothetical protein